MMFYLIPAWIPYTRDYLKEVRRTGSDAAYVKAEQIGRLYLLPQTRLPPYRFDHSAALALHNCINCSR